MQEVLTATVAFSDGESAVPGNAGRSTTSRGRIWASEVMTATWPRVVAATMPVGMSGHAFGPGVGAAAEEVPAAIPVTGHQHLALLVGGSSRSWFLYRWSG